MSFWRWCLSPFSGIREIRKSSFTFAEYAGGIIIIGIGITGFVLTSPWFLLLIPVGIIVMAHAWWREFER